MFVTSLSHTYNLQFIEIKHKLLNSLMFLWTFIEYPGTEEGFTDVLDYSHVIRSFTSSDSQLYMMLPSANESKRVNVWTDCISHSLPSRGNWASCHTERERTQDGKPHDYDWAKTEWMNHEVSHYIIKKNTT